MVRHCIYKMNIAIIRAEINSPVQCAQEVRENPVNNMALSSVVLWLVENGQYLE